MSRAVNIIMYHYVRELAMTRYPGIKALLTSQFKAQLDFLTGNGFHFVSCAQVTEAWAGGKELPENSVLLTFDDGYADHYTNVFPILKLRGIPAFFSMPGRILAERHVLDVNKIHFLLACKDSRELVPVLFQKLDHYRGAEFEIPPNEELYGKFAVAGRFDTADTIFIKRVLQVELDRRLRSRIIQELFSKYVTDREEQFSRELYLSEDQVRLMAQSGMSWGLHGYEHDWMNRLSGDALRTDIRRALEVFDGVVPRHGWMFCYPYGSVSDAVVRVAKEEGAIGGFTTVTGRCRMEKDDVFHLPRWDTNDFPPKSVRFQEEEGCR